jgi:conjugal transfer mating pair stabilization protein TraN
MQTKLNKFWKLACLVVALIIASIIHTAYGGRFTSRYPCRDGVKTCVSKGERVVDGFKITKDCWEWSYLKTCQYPSKDDCRNYGHCYFVANLDCLLRDDYGNCVNQKQEFSCESWYPITIENQTVRTGLVEKDGPETLVCKGVPCIDGNCVDKSYMTDGEMMDSISKLYATSKMNPDKNGNFSLFQGSSMHCSKKATSYSDCCRKDPKGWGKKLGAKCTKDENDLAEKRAKNLCKYVGKSESKILGVTTVVKHHFCCWGQMLDKVVQVEGRKQLGMNFGSGGSPNCRGLTLDEIQRLDFSKIDFSEFIEDFKVKFTGKYKAPDPNGIAKTIDGSSKNIRRYDNNPHNKENNLTGWNGKVDGELLDEEQSK